jgi:hypothetical protein
VLDFLLEKDICKSQAAARRLAHMRAIKVDGTLADLSRPIEGAKTIKVGRKTFNTDEM